MSETQVVYSVVVPVYGSEGTLETLHERLTAAMRGLERSFELVFVDDASPDGAWQVLERIQEKDREHVRIVRLMRNYGQHNALMCGFGYTRGEWVITLDDDLQNPPEEIGKLIAKAAEGHDVVYGKYISKRHSRFRNLGSKAVQFVYKRTFSMQGDLTSFRIMHRRVVEGILRYRKSYVFIDGLLVWQTRRVAWTPVEHHERRQGRSGYSLGKLISLALNLVTNFSIVPLQVSSLLGTAFAGLGFCLAFYMSIKKVFFGIPVTGWASLMVTVTIIGGVQLLTLGMIGEYLGRIHLNINDKPQYEVREARL